VRGGWFGQDDLCRRLGGPGVQRLSVDEEIWLRFGRYGVDYSPGGYARLSQDAEDVVRRRLVDVVGQGCDVVVDLSFWRRASRDRYKQLVETAGGRWRLLYLQSGTTYRTSSGRTEPTVPITIGFGTRLAGTASGVPKVGPLPNGRRRGPGTGADFGPTTGPGVLGHAVWR